jgi:Uma2 family endonuclease
MSLTFADSRNPNIKIPQQVANWANQDGTGEVFDLASGFTLPNGAIRSPDTAWTLADRWNALSPEQQVRARPLYLER